MATSKEAIPPIGGVVVGVVMVVAVVSSRSSLSLRSTVIDAVQRLSLDMSAFIGLLVDFDLSGEWAFDNAPSCAHWVADRAAEELCTVREWLRVGHALTAVDEVAKRFADGRLSYSKVRVLTRIADVDNQHELCSIAERCPASRLPVELAKMAQRARKRRRTRQTAAGGHDSEVAPRP